MILGACEADEYFLAYEPRHASMLRSSLSPTIFDAGYRINVIPSESAAHDFRALPDENIEDYLDQIRQVINDDSIRSVSGSGIQGLPVKPALTRRHLQLLRKD